MIASRFLDYLYRVESRQPGTQGGGKSSWFSLRSGEGGNSGFRFLRRISAFTSMNVKLL